MKKLDLAKAAEAVFAFRPDEAYTVADILAMWRVMGVEARTYRRGEIVLKAGMPAKEMVFVISGVLHLRMTSAIGEDILVTAVRPGEYIGISQIFSPKKRHLEDVVVFSDAQVVVFDVARLRAWRTDSRSLPFFNHIGQHLCNLIDESRAKAAILGGATITERLRRYLSIRMRRDRSRTVAIPGTLGDLASYLGVNKCALSRVMGQLRDEGKIDYRRNVITVRS